MRHENKIKVLEKSFAAVVYSLTNSQHHQQICVGVFEVGHSFRVVAFLEPNVSFALKK